jgi:hypothetical protein
MRVIAPTGPVDAPHHTVPAVVGEAPGPSADHRVP